MRPGQNNGGGGGNKNRSRGRNNNNGGRKHMNPLSRNYESNGPDVKVRGNPAHIAEKYVQLARDAHASGDSVMAENYLQHAEHYFRIISAAMPQQRDQFGQEIESEEAEDEFDGGESDRFEMPQLRMQQQNDFRTNNNGQQGDRPPQQNSNGGGGGYDRQNRDDRPRFDQQQPRYDQQPRAEQQGQPRFEAPRVEQTPPLAEGADEGQSAEFAAAPPQAAADGQDENALPRRMRERRPRRRRPQVGENGPIDPNGPQPEVGELPAFITAGGTGNTAE